MAAKLRALLTCLAFWTMPGRSSNYIKSGTDWTTRGCQVTTNSQQSPIDINYMSCSCSENYEIDVALNPQQSSPASVGLSGDPSTIVLTLDESFGFLVFRSTAFASRLYFPRQLVFRTPSEHTNEGIQYPLEMQIFWRSTNDQNLATSILFEMTYSAPSSVFFLDFLTLAKNKSRYNSTVSFASTLRNSFEYQGFFSGDTQFFYYNGSFSSGNCTPGLEWIVLKNRLLVNQTDLATFQNLLSSKTGTWNNSRVVQPNMNRFVAVGGITCSDFYSNLFWFCIFFGVVFLVVFKEM
jgi:carbonic anhydrase